MRRSTKDPFVDGVLDRIEDLETPRALDRDARRAILLTGLVTLLMIGVVIVGMVGNDEDQSTAAVGPSIDPAAIGEALRRLQVDSPSSQPSGPNPATPAGDDRYESGDASAPGRRT
ncbi:MAG: hypothetical protein CMJ23_13915 [Phycisphaerae bacterium]|nr:hypothetical protein [Phycisphaerae bacterium]